MRIGSLLLMAIASHNLWADSIQSYMKIANNIPKMEIKADSHSQALARSSRSVLAITNESIAETMLEANEMARKKGKPLFCLPAGTQLSAKTLDVIIQKQATEVLAHAKANEPISISSVAWKGVLKNFPCTKNSAAAQRMAHVADILNR